MKLKMDVSKTNKNIHFEMILEGNKKVVKTVTLVDFLKQYNGFKKNHIDYDYIYMPPGCVDFCKSRITSIYTISTLGYEDFYNADNQYLITLKISNSNNTLIKAIIYKTEGRFNKILSRFHKIGEINNANKIFSSKDDAVKHTIEFANTLTSKIETCNKITYNDVLKNML